MNQRDVAFALELVARVLEQRWSSDPEDDERVTNYTLDEIAGEIRSMAETLKRAPGQPDPGSVKCEPDLDHWGEPSLCVYHPLGGPDCVV